MSRRKEAYKNMADKEYINRTEILAALNESILKDANCPLFVTAIVEQLVSTCPAITVGADNIRKALADWRPELNHIIEALGTEELLAQLAEEAAELGKAALKLRRALNGKNPTPVSPAETLRNVREKMADVLLCSISVGLDENITERTIREKIPRWSGRIDHDPDSDCPGYDEGFHDDAGGYHEGGCGWDPLGRFCGECSCGDCGQCPRWAHDTMPGGDSDA